jgi:hypothetical protein
MKEYAVMPLSDYKGICDSIRNKTKEEKEIKSGNIPIEINAVYEQGKQAEYDRFWDIVQDYGNRTQYSFAFSGDMWVQENFKPKYPIRMVGNQTNVFCYWGQAGSPMRDKKVDFRNVVILDLTECTGCSNLFYMNTVISAFGTLDTSNSKISELRNTFSSDTNIKIIEKIILKDDGSQVFVAVFNYCGELVDIAFEGVMGQNGLNLQWSTKLSHDSIVSTINCLSTTTSGLSVTLSKTAVENAFTDEEWTELEQTRPNWTIVLV